MGRSEMEKNDILLPGGERDGSSVDFCFRTEAFMEGKKKKIQYCGDM
jgi:hypothetical protein